MMGDIVNMSKYGALFGAAFGVNRIAPRHMKYEWANFSTHEQSEPEQSREKAMCIYCLRRTERNVGAADTTCT